MISAIAPDFPRIRLGVSACLLGERVRYDGGHKRNDFIVDILARHVDYVSVCPEAGMGMGIPRPPIQLVGQPGQIRALGVENPDMDVTDRLQDYAQRQWPSLASISGYIFKQNSPSCGLRKVKLFRQPGQGMQRKGTGVFASALLRLAPLLPVTEEDCFDDPQQRENFITRIYVYRRWQDLLASGLTAEKLLAFHTAHKLLVRVYSQAAERRLAQLLANPSSQALEKISTAYIPEFMQTLKRPARKRQPYKVLLHPYPRSLWHQTGVSRHPS